MKRLLVILILLCCANMCKAEEIAEEPAVVEEAEQIIEMKENKIIVNVQKQPLNENSKQKIILKKNWFVVNIQVNGKVKVKPMQMEYEVE